MKLLVGKHYKLRVNLYGRIEEYRGIVLSVSSNEFRFETEDDNMCRALTLRKSEVVWSKEIDLKKEDKTHFISSKKQFHNLKESVKPEF